MIEHVVENFLQLECCFLAGIFTNAFWQFRSVNGFDGGVEQSLRFLDLLARFGTPTPSRFRSGVLHHIAHQLAGAGHGRIELDQAQARVGVHNLAEKALLPALTPGFQLSIERLLAQPEHRSVWISVGPLFDNNNVSSPTRDRTDANPHPDGQQRQQTEQGSFQLASDSSRTHRASRQDLAGH